MQSAFVNSFSHMWQPRQRLWWRVVTKESEGRDSRQRNVERKGSGSVFWVSSPWTPDGVDTPAWIPTVNINNHIGRHNTGVEDGGQCALYGMVMGVKSTWSVHLKRWRGSVMLDQTCSKGSKTPAQSIYAKASLKYCILKNIFLHKLFGEEMSTCKDLVQALR